MALYNERYYLESKLAQLEKIGAKDSSGQAYTIETLRQAIADSGMTVKQHYDTYHIKEGTSGNPYYNEAYYIQSKLAQLQNSGVRDDDGNMYTEQTLRLAIAKAGMTVEQHYERFHTQEGTSGSPLFNTTEYLENKVAQYKSFNATSFTVDTLKELLAKYNMTAEEHYERYGCREIDATGHLINPSNAFDANAYYAAKLAELQKQDPEHWAEKTTVDVMEVFSAVGLSPSLHYLLYGAKEAADSGVAMVQTVPVVQRVANDPLRELTGENVPSNYNKATGAAKDLSAAAVTKPCDMSDPTVARPDDPVSTPSDADFIPVPGGGIVDTNAVPVLLIVDEVRDRDDTIIASTAQYGVPSYDKDGIVAIYGVNGVGRVLDKADPIRTIAFFNDRIVTKTQCHKEDGTIVIDTLTEMRLTKEVDTIKGGADDGNLLIYGLVSANEEETTLHAKDSIDATVGVEDGVVVSLVGKDFDGFKSGYAKDFKTLTVQTEDNEVRSFSTENITGLSEFNLSGNVTIVVDDQSVEKKTVTVNAEKGDTHISFDGNTALIKPIVFNGGTGSDTLDVLVGDGSLVTFTGDYGNDTANITLADGTHTFTMVGDLGGDREDSVHIDGSKNHQNVTIDLTAVSQYTESEILGGNLYSDTITGGTGDDVIYGGAVGPKTIASTTGVNVPGRGTITIPADVADDSVYVYSNSGDTSVVFSLFGISPTNLAEYLAEQGTSVREVLRACTSEDYFCKSFYYVNDNYVLNTTDKSNYKITFLRDDDDNETDILVEWIGKNNNKIDLLEYQSDNVFINIDTEGEIGRPKFKFTYDKNNVNNGCIQMSVDDNNNVDVRKGDLGDLFGTDFNCNIAVDVNNEVTTYDTVYVVDTVDGFGGNDTIIAGVQSSPSSGTPGYVSTIIKNFNTENDSLGFAKDSGEGSIIDLTADSVKNLSSFLLAALDAKAAGIYAATIGSDTYLVHVIDDSKYDSIVQLVGVRDVEGISLADGSGYGA